MKQSTKDSIINAAIGAIITGAFSLLVFCLGNCTNQTTVEKKIEENSSESFDSVDKDMPNQESENEALKQTINEQQKNVENDSNQLYKLDPELFNGTWSGTYTGTTYNKPEVREISLYIGMYDINGNVQGVAEIEEGNFGYYYWEGSVDFESGVFSFERKKWLSNNKYKLSKIKYITTYNAEKEYFSGYITKDTKRTIQFSKTENSEKLAKYWDLREDLIRQYN